jgi:ketosteroid isomerase-like protein
MSQQNVEIVMRWFELLGRGERAAALRYVDPAIETHEGVELPGATSYFGHAGLAMAYDHWASQFDDLRIELKELVDAGGDVVAVTRHHGRGRASGAAVQAVVAYVLTVEDGKLVRMRIFNTKTEALEAAGLRK